MFDFDEYENLDDYTFTYPALEVLQHTYHKGLKQKDKSLPIANGKEGIPLMTLRGTRGVE